MSPVASAPGFPPRGALQRVPSFWFAQYTPVASAVTDTGKFWPVASVWDAPPPPLGAKSTAFICGSTQYTLVASTATSSASSMLPDATVVIGPPPTGTEAMDAPMGANTFTPSVARVNEPENKGPRRTAGVPPPRGTDMRTPGLPPLFAQ